MKRQLLITFVFFLPLLLFSQNAKKVLIIGMDGCRADALQLANTPSIDGLIANGIFSPDALNNDITVSGPGWSSMLCGVWSDKHLVINNSFTGDNYENYPSIFKLIDDTNADLHTVSICHWNPINDFIVQEYADFKLNVDTDEAVSAQAVAYISANDPDLIFLHFDDIDHAGHASGFSPNNPAYISAIETVDAQIEPILAAIEARENYADEEWLILISSDHGGVGNSHGGTSIEHQNVIVLASGNSVTPALIQKDSAVIVDNIENCLADDTVELRFDGNNDYVNIVANKLFDFGTAQDFTIECRVRTNIAADVAIIGNKDWNSGVNKGFVFSFRYASGPEWKVNIGDGSNRADINTGGEIADNEWHTLSVTFDRDGFMKMYEGGVFVDSTSIAVIGDITTGEGLFLGTDINNGYGYSGAIAEVRVWDNVLTPSTIADWNCSRVDDTHPDIDHLIGYWKLNEGAGSTEIIDYSTHENNGIITDATWDSPDSTIVYDYSATPRITDIAVTAMTHLCLPFEEAWDLDGHSLIPECTTLGNENIATPNYKVSPNPFTDLLIIEGENLKNISIINQIGQRVWGTTTILTKNELDLSHLNGHIFFVKLIFQNGSTAIEKIIKLK